MRDTFGGLGLATEIASATHSTGMATRPPILAAEMPDQPNPSIFSDTELTLKRKRLIADLKL